MGWREKTITRRFGSSIASTDFQNLEDQLLAFEKGSGAHDDAPDALQSAIVEVNQITFVTKFEPKATSRKELIKNKKNRF